MPERISLSAIVTPGISAIRRYWKPFLLLQAVALALVVGYFTNSEVKRACETLSQLKQHAGLIFSAISAAIAGALLPELAKAIMLGDRRVHRQRVRDVGFAIAIFALDGLIVDLQYRVFGWIFGTDGHPATVIKKVCADMLVATPLYGVPYWLVVYELRARRYNLLTTLRQLSPTWYLLRALPLLVPAWAFWTPMVILIYVLPGPLQFCLFCVALAAWSLLMVFVAAQPPMAAAL